MNITFPPSIFGARCDVLMDIVVVSMIIILPLLWYSFKKVKVERNYKLHKNIQLIMFIILFFVVLLFEYDMKQNGGIFEMVKGSSYEGTFFLNFMIYFHTLLSITTSLIWIILLQLLQLNSEIILIRGNLAKHINYGAKQECGTWRSPV